MVDDDRKHVGVVDHALINMLPVGAAVGSLPGQVPGSGIDGVGILGIDRDRFNILDVGGVRGRQALPGIAAIVAAIDAIERAGDHYVGITLVHGQGADRFAVHRGQRLPVWPPSTGAEDFADLLARSAPRRHINTVGILRIDGDVVEHVIVAAQARQARPGASAIVRSKHLAGAGAEQDVIGIMRVVSQAARIAAVRT
jgi:hypothetical protein